MDLSQQMDDGLTGQKAGLAGLGQAIDRTNAELARLRIENDELRKRLEAGKTGYDPTKHDGDWTSADVPCATTAFWRTKSGHIYFVDNGIERESGFTLDEAVAKIDTGSWVRVAPPEPKAEASTFSPGPLHRGEENAARIAIAGGEGRTIAHVLRGLDGKGEGYFRLFLAAPEMYDLLKDAMTSIPDSGYAIVDENKWVPLLARIEGRQP